MHVECSIIPVDFVRENLSVTFARQQDIELQGDSWFVFQAPISMRYQQWQELMPPLGCDFNCDDDRKPGHDRCSFAAVCGAPAVRSCRAARKIEGHRCSAECSDAWRATISGKRHSRNHKLGNHVRLI